nr:MAG TPA_asm: minor capsid protein [Caudoviricetes sp.]
MSSLSFHDKQHVLRLLNQQGQVKRIFDDFTRRSGLILTKWTEKNTDNVWIRNTTLEKQIDKLLTELHDNLLININNNTTGAWEASNLKNDDLLKAFIKDLSLPEIIGKSRYEKLEQGMFSRNMDALKAFQQRKIDGLTLSDTVWKSVEGAKENLEYYLSSGISTGRPAASISQDIRQLLQNPDKRFRRVKNDEGKLIMSKPMQDYTPGQGRYRSSYKNALRVAATETNQAYHTADYERWSKQGFVLGIEVFRSKSNKGPCAICDPMVGRYPKDYKFKGQHPWCICQAVPIMLEGEEYIDYLLTGVVPEDKIIKTVPQSAIDFVNAKEANQNQWFVKENSKYLLNIK